MPVCRYMEENGSAAMLIPKRLPSLALKPKGDVPEVQNNDINVPIKRPYVFQKKF